MDLRPYAIVSPAERVGDNLFHVTAGLVDLSSRQDADPMGDG